MWVNTSLPSHQLLWQRTTKTKNALGQQKGQCGGFLCHCFQEASNILLGRILVCLCVVESGSLSRVSREKRTKISRIPWLNWKTSCNEKSLIRHKSSIHDRWSYVGSSIKQLDSSFVATWTSWVHFTTLLLQGGKEDVSKLLKWLLRAKNEKLPLHHICAQGMAQLISKVSHSTHQLVCVQLFCLAMRRNMRLLSAGGEDMLWDCTVPGLGRRTGWRMGEVYTRQTLGAACRKCPSSCEQFLVLSMWYARRALSSQNFVSTWSSLLLHRKSLTGHFCQSIGTANSCWVTKHGITWQI